VRIGVLLALRLGHVHVQQLAPARHHGGQPLALFVVRCGDELGALVVAGQHVGQLAQAACVDAVGLGQRAHGLGEVACLARIDARHLDARVLQRAHQATLVSAAGLHDHQVHLPGPQDGDHLAPSRRVVAKALLEFLAAQIQVLLGHIDTGVGANVAGRYPALWMQVHVWQLFGLHEWDETGQCVDRELCGELEARGLGRFGAPTANRWGREAVDKWTVLAALGTAGLPWTTLRVAHRADLCPLAHSHHDHQEDRTQKRTYKGCAGRVRRASAALSSAGLLAARVLARFHI